MTFFVWGCEGGQVLCNYYYYFCKYCVYFIYYEKKLLSCYVDRRFYLRFVVDYDLCFFIYGQGWAKCIVENDFMAVVQNSK